jgi:hypothetical protein
VSDVTTPVIEVRGPRTATRALDFIERVLIDPATGKPFVLLDAERWFLKFAFTLDADGRLMFPELIYGAIKKSGKTTFAAVIVTRCCCCSVDGSGQEGAIAGRPAHEHWMNSPSSGRIQPTIRL